MFAHKVLEDANKSEALFFDTTKGLSDDQKNAYKDLIDYFFQRIPVAHTFYFKEATDIYSKADDGIPLSLTLQKNQTYLKLPYKTTALAWDIKKTARKFCLLQQKKEIIYINMADYSFVDSHFYIQPIILALDTNEPDFYLTKDSISMLDKVSYDTKHARGHYVAVGAFIIDVLKLLHCKNVVSETIKAPQKLNKKRVKNNKLPILEYKILKVALPSSRKKSTTCLSTRTTRLHFCRGHFKEYTPEKKLFGRVTGLFWWQPHVRGNKKQGVILKDYEIV